MKAEADRRLEMAEIAHKLYLKELGEFPAAIGGAAAPTAPSVELQVETPPIVPEEEEWSQVAPPHSTGSRAGSRASSVPRPQPGAPPRRLPRQPRESPEKCTDCKMQCLHANFFSKKMRQSNPKGRRRCKGCVKSFDPREEGLGNKVQHLVSSSY